jgi:heme a synthase
MFGTDRRITSLRKMALLCAALVLAITSLSAFMRLSKAGLGCDPWPQCYAQGARGAGPGVQPAADALVTAARITHRVVAIIALMLIIAMLMTTLARVPMLKQEGAIVLALLVLALFLAVLGRWTTDARVPAVVLGNLMGGFAMFALSVRLVRATGAGVGSAPVSGGITRWVWVGIGLVVVQIALGGLVSATHAGLSCPELTRCDAGAASWHSLNPWHEPRYDMADPVNRAGALVHLLHRIGAVLVAAVLLPLGVAAWRRGRRAGAALIALLAIQVSLGVALVLGGLPLAIALAHNAVAASLLAVLLTLAGQEKVRGSPVGPSAR